MSKHIDKTSVSIGAFWEDVKGTFDQAKIGLKKPESLKLDERAQAKSIKKERSHSP